MSKIASSIAVLMIVLSGCASAEPLYWKATKGEKELMILGSIHMGKEDMYPLPEAITQYLLSSDALILEADLQSAPSKLPSSEELSADYLSTEQKKKLKKIGREVGISDKFLLSQPTWRTALILQLAYYSILDYQEHLGIDNYISKKARQQGIEIKGLETVEYQLSLFADSKQTGRDLLDDIINEWDKNKEISECLMSDWISGDKNKLESLVIDMSESDELIDTFIYDRNRNWADKLDSSDFINEKGQYLVVVGTLHLVGENSLIALLESKGFEVTQLSQSRTSECPVP